MAQCILNLGAVEQKRGNIKAAAQAFEEAAALGRELGTPHVIASALNNLGNLAGDRCDYPAAEGLFGDSLDIKNRLGNRKDIATTLNGLGNMAIDRGQFELAVEYFDQIASIGAPSDDVECLVSGLVGKGNAHRSQGEQEESGELFRRALQIAKKSNYRLGVATVLNNMMVGSQLGFPQKMEIYGECLQIFGELGDHSGIATAQRNLGDVALHNGDYQTARSLYQAALAAFRDRGEKLNAALCLEAIGDYLVSRGQLEDTTRLYAVVDQVREDAGVSLLPLQRPGYDARIRLLRARLGDPRFCSAWRVGKSWPLKDAMAFAVAVSI